MDKNSNLEPSVGGAPEAREGALWDVNDVAKYLKTSTSWVRHRVSENALPFMRVGGWMVRFDPVAIRAWARERPAGSVKKLDR